MRIAVSTEDPHLDAEVSPRFGTSPYLLIVDLDTGAVEAVPNPGATAKRGASMQAVVLAVSNEVMAVLTGWCSPTARNQLAASGIEVYTGLRGRARDVLKKYSDGDLARATPEPVTSPRWFNLSKDAVVQALASSARQFGMMLPLLVGVVLLIGLFNAFVPRTLLLSVFSGNPAVDTLLGALFGSLFAGNPVNSYVIGGELLGLGVSLFAVTGFIIAWVSVGVIQLPAEMAALGKVFALLRNGLSLVMAILIAVVTALLMGLAYGWSQ
ncbi:MAG: NifB/NifX family molybdenum-iron cluster-binding protein [Chloroflexota bacterium]|nr:NifB/NifX family molybdenum-iron cluster-binding protein [Chloroflexota bacterium]